MKSFTIKILGVSAGLIVLSLLVFSLFLPGYYIPVLPFMLLFFLIINLLVHAFQLKLIRKDIARFTRSNMVITFLKLVVYSVFAIVYLAIVRENALVFVICLMLIYLVFSFVEVAEITRVLRRK